MSVPNPDDVSFKNFFKSFEQANNNNNVESVDVSQEDFDSVQRQSLLVIRKNVQVQKRRGATRNPIKALAARSDITNEYTEVITGVAEREKKRLNIEKCKLSLVACVFIYVWFILSSRLLLDLFRPDCILGKVKVTSNYLIVSQ